MATRRYAEKYHTSVTELRKMPVADLLREIKEAVKEAEEDARRMKAESKRRR
jgi:hypothetical protein